MEYTGRYPIFDATRIRTYPLSERRNKVRWTQLTHPEAVLGGPPAPQPVADAVAPVAQAMARARERGWPVVLFSGAHVLKNGFGPLIADWMRRGTITLYGVNTAGTIHDFELALIGETSEYVPSALGRGEFGMAYEFCYINEAIREGNRRKLGYGESLSRMIADAEFRARVLERAWREGAPRAFAHPEVSVLAASAETGVPVTVHAVIGGDVIDQHPSFDGEAKGGTSGRDFLVFVEHMRRFRDGGVFVNLGSAVIGPEVFLKSVSMVCNVGDALSAELVTADFDIRPASPEAMSDERQFGYYFRDQKSVVTRIPQAFGGRGVYVQGDQLITFPELFRQMSALTGR
jgi:hypothetical protein